MNLKLIEKNIWIYEGSVVNFHGFPFTTRMTVVKLANGNLWVHSPEKINDELQKELKALGEVKYLISPNKLHHLFIEEWIEVYPHAITYASPRLSKKKPDINFSVELSMQPESDWKLDIDQTIIQGSPAMEEVVFYHKTSKTLILTDAIENFDPGTLVWWQRILGKFAGVLSPKGKMPIDWRISFYFGSRNKARESLKTIMSWDIDNILLSHGKCIIGDGHKFLERSYSWLIKT